MYSKNGGSSPWSALWRAPLRALLLGGVAAVAAGLFGAAGGAVLCLADGLPWTYAGDWGMRGAFGGLVAGAIIGALSGFHHVDERRPRRGPDSAAPDAPPLGDRGAQPARPAVLVERNGLRRPV